MADRTTHAPDRLGGRYLLLDKLGSGGMATVYRAWDERLEVFRAVKILGAGFADKPRIRQRLEREARVMAQLSHPNIVTLHELGQDGDRLYLVMELLVGGSLMERIVHDGPLPPRMSVGVIEGVLSALVLAHEHGVVHRDVKPHNVLLDAEGTAKVTDFGIARMDAAAEMTRTGAVLGTLAYMPPEQKLSARKVDARSDLYAVGGTLFCLLTGREPFDLYVAGLDAALAEDFFAGVPPALVPVIRQATAFRMDDRFASAALMLAALRRGAATLPVDPAGPALVDPVEMARARANASLGPTILAEPGVADLTDPSVDGASTTNTMQDDARRRSGARAEDTFPFPRPGTVASAGDDPTPEPGPVVVPPPAVRSPGGRPLAVVALLGLGALLVLVPVLVMAALSFAPLRRAPPEPAPLPSLVTAPLRVTTPAPPPAPAAAAPASATPGELPEAPMQSAPVPVAPVESAPIADAPPQSAPIPQPLPPAPEAPPEPAIVPVVIVPVPVAPEPAVAVVDVVRPPEPAPVAAPPPQPPPPAPAPAASRRGWQVEIRGTGRVDPDVYAVLEADAAVRDRSGAEGRPAISVACTRGKLRVTLRAGVSSVEPILTESGLPPTQAFVRYADAAGTVEMKATFDPGLPSELVFQRPFEPWVRRMAASPTISLTYSPFSTAPVTAQFTGAQAASMVAAMTEHCGYR